MGKRRSSFIASDESGDERPAKVSKKASKANSSGDSTVDADGNVFWEVCTRLSWLTSFRLVGQLTPSP